MTEPEQTNPNAGILAPLAASGQKNARLGALVHGESLPGPDADGERIDGEPATDDNPDEEDA